MVKRIRPKKKDRVVAPRNWYIIHVHSGCEDQVAETLKQKVESLGMQDKIFNVMVPKEKQLELRDGKKKVVEKKIYPGYVFVDMIVTEDSWYVVRNTPNVTGFLGFGTRPSPASPEEIERLKKRMGIAEPKYKIDLKEGETVKIVDGPFSGFEGTVEELSLIHI